MWRQPQIRQISKGKKSSKKKIFNIQMTKLDHLEKN